MFDIGGKTWRHDLPLRGVGLVLLASCWLLAGWLFRSPGLHHHHAPSAVELGAAAIGYLCFSAGAAMIVAGAHLFDRIAIAQRWAARDLSA